MVFKGFMVKKREGFEGNENNNKKNVDPFSI